MRHPLLLATTNDHFQPKVGVATNTCITPLELKSYIHHCIQCTKQWIELIDNSVSVSDVTCACGTKFFHVHETILCIRHNEVRDKSYVYDVCIEPSLQPITGETLTGASAVTDDGARFDVAANRYWGGRFERTFFDVGAFNL